MFSQESAITAPLLVTKLKNDFKDIESPPILSAAEDTPAYAVLQEYNLLDTRFRKNTFDEIFMENDFAPNSSKSDTFAKRFRWGVYWTPCCGLIIYRAFNTEVIVPPGHVCCFIDNDSNYLFAKPGVHNITSPFLKRVSAPIPITEPIEHGNRTIVTVPQGMLGYATDMGQPILLPPGLHSWISETIVYEDLFSLEDHVICIGPYTILTVDEGYAAITQNNGLQVVLEGGKTHLLTHQKWRFEKFITQKIQTDDLEKIQAASADNVIMSVNSTVVWKIKDVRVAATMAAETMSNSRNEDVPANISKLRRDVLKQAIASLAGFIGSVNYSDSFHVAAAAQRNMETAVAVVEGSEVVPIGTNTSATPAAAHEEIHSMVPKTSTENPMFDNDRMSDSVSHANQITNKYGVEILSINIISANPVDEHLTASLATGAVASAEALQAETQARGLAKARKIEAESKAITRKVDASSEAEAVLVLAKAEGQADVLKAQGWKEAEILRAEGSKMAAQLLETSSVAVELEKMKTSGNAIKDSDKFFFAQEPEYMANMLMKTQE